MKRLTTLALLVLLSSTLLYGQDTLTTYLNLKNRRCNKELAIYYRKAYPDSSGMWIVEKYHKNGQLRMFGKYSDKKLKRQQGIAVFFITADKSLKLDNIVTIK